MLIFFNCDTTSSSVFCNAIAAFYHPTTFIIGKRWSLLCW